MQSQVPVWRAALLSLAILTLFLGVWEIAVRPSGVSGPALDPEYAALLGQAAAQGQQTPIPAPSAIARRLFELLSDPFHQRGTNDQGIGIQIAWSLWRVMAGFLLAMVVAIPLGFVIGMSPLLNAALNPFIQVLRPVSPLAWMPLALYTIKDSSISSIFVIFICSVWPMLLNTAFGVASVRREWLNVARTLEAGRWRTAMHRVRDAAREALSRVGLTNAAARKPSQLSGGMKQRVGIARALAVAPKLLLMDEPFSALDALTRGSLQEEVSRFVTDAGQTAFMITHDVDEAILLADRILLMTNGPQARVAEVVHNHLPRPRTRADLHHMAGYHPLRDHIMDFLITRSRTLAGVAPANYDARIPPAVHLGG